MSLRWWADTLDWQVIYESDEEIVIVPKYVMEESFSTPWERRPPGLVFVPVPEDKTVKNRLHMDLAPHLSDDRDALIQGLLDRGAKRIDVGQPADATFTVLADPEGNEFCVLSAREQ
ncbi:VOC family protein [Haematomicrobium sanguinis]|uniref:VOC family protein n=1 Tax=Haematomicrobium sanguinis TaxID=479106 RepID=UPI00069164A1|nr:VOC family protein [Haematomicrobium sanguinis]